MAEAKERDTARTEATDTTWCKFRSAFCGDGPMLLGVCSGIAGLPIWRNFKYGSFELEVKAVHLRVLLVAVALFIPRILVVAYLLAWFIVFRHADD